MSFTSLTNNPSTNPMKSKCDFTNMFAIKAQIDSVSFHLYVLLVHMNSGEIHMISKIAVQPFSTPNSNISNIERVTIYRYVLGIWNTHTIFEGNCLNV